MAYGGTIKLTGESEYRKSLNQITQSLKVVSAEMRATSSSFANGDRSTEQMARASQQLSRSLDQQKQALSSLKSKLAEMQSEYNKSGQKHQELLNKYNQEKAKLEEIGREYGTTSQKYKDQQRVVNELGQEVQQSARAYEQQGRAVNDMRIRTANAETTINQTTRALDEMGNEAEDSGKKASKGSEGFTVMKGILANLGTQAIQSAINGIRNLGNTFKEVGKQALESYSSYEQLSGGVKKLFGDEMAQQVEKNANQAFKTAGMSANDYMETVTSFSASLISGLNGDTQKATEVSDKAIRDMSDNANTFGTSMTDIQNAYQGFAKGNFTMLDNLKLG